MNNPEYESSLLEIIDKSSEDLYQEAPCGYIFTHPDGRFVKTNKTFLKWIKFSKEEIVTKRFQDLLTIGSKIYYETNYGPLLQIQGYLNEVTLDMITKDESNIPVIINSYEMKDESGKVILIKSTLFNITDRRKYEKELLVSKKKAEESQKRFELLSYAGETFGHSIDYSNNFRTFADHATREFCNICTIDLHEHGHRRRVAHSDSSSEKSLAEEHLPDTYQALPEAILITDLDQPNDQVILNNNIPWAKNLVEASDCHSLIMSPIFKDNINIGTISFYLAELGRKFSTEDLELVKEIALRAAVAIETSQLNMALNESHEWLSTTLHSIADAVITVNTDKTISFVNPVAVELIGRSVQEVYGKPISDFFRINEGESGEIISDPVEEVLSTGSTVKGLKNNALTRGDGSKIIIENIAAPIKNSEGKTKGVVLVFRDITIRHYEEQEKQETLIRLREEREIREKFVATLTHDLRSPITAVKMSAQLILRKSDQQQLVQELTVRVINNVNRVDQMIQDLLDANRIRSGNKIALEMTPGDLNHIVNESIIDLSTIYGDRFKFFSQGIIKGNWNPSGIKRIMENLCSNAVKYGTPHSFIEIKLTVDKMNAVLSVHNQGPPISQIDQATLFEPYKRTESAQESGQRGWGLGLTLVRGVAEAHGGKAMVESSTEKGTTFSVILPIHEE